MTAPQYTEEELSSFEQCEETTKLYYGGHEVVQFRCSLDKAHNDPDTDTVYEGTYPLHTAFHEETGEQLAEWSTGTVFHAKFESEGSGHVVESVEEEPAG